MKPRPESRAAVAAADLLAMAESGLAAVAPASAVGLAATRSGHLLSVGETEIDLSAFGRVVVLGFGKASIGMARALLPLLEGKQVTGTLVADVGGPASPLEVLEAAHPVPDERSVRAGKRILEAARAAGSSDLIVVLISGGGSSLIAVPTAGVSLADLQKTNEVLVRSGATINDFNTVRKHLSDIKGGRLAEALAGAGAIVTLVISDVVGNAVDAIASGPTVPDPTTFADALAVLDRFDVRKQMPTSVVRHLRAGVSGALPDTPSAGSVFEKQTVHIVADGAAAARAAASTAADLGYEVEVASTRLVGETRLAAGEVVAAARRLRPGQGLVYAGETTVTVTGDGVGGRNQELALAAAIVMAGEEGLTLLSFGTDGIDGKTPVAGGYADGTAVARGRALGLDAADYLQRNDSHTYLSAIGDTVTTGPTGTNVCDLVLLVRSRSSM